MVVFLCRENLPFQFLLVEYVVFRTFIFGFLGDIDPL